MFLVFGDQASDASRLLCPKCLVRCHAHQLRLSGRNSVTFYGCRSCRQSREFMDWPGEVVAVLDMNMKEEQVKDGNALRVNWLARGELFDFDRIEIINAGDKDVERFAIQVSNDLDGFRTPRYSEMPCLVSSECQLEENTVRVLKHMFALLEEPAS